MLPDKNRFERDAKAVARSNGVMLMIAGVLLGCLVLVVPGISFWWQRVGFGIGILVIGTVSGYAAWRWGTKR